ncbi:MAG: DUF2202 domain-containing protein [Solirubrobacteraceae bacterium]|nr:DUF2202 domain-containing protein [Solirubrobacteraceae bacterium]
MSGTWRIATAGALVCAAVAMAVVAARSDDPTPGTVGAGAPGVSSGQVAEQASPQARPQETPSPAATLTTEQAAALAYLREEEKLARDVYLVLSGTSGDRRFTMIGRSEQQHYDMVGGLLATYGVPDPALGRKPGAFTDPALQDAYDDFVQRGSVSREAALAVGREIERMDLADLAERRAGLPQPDIQAVVDRLAAGSQRHLAAFSR